MYLHYLEFKFSSGQDKWEAFKNLGRPEIHFKDFENLRFAKAMGTGSGNGFSIVPSFSKYGFLLVFESEKLNFKSVWDAKIFNDYKAACDSFLHVAGRPVKSHGKWDGRNPFESAHINHDPSLPIAVLTRATIRIKRLLEFWRHVPKTSRFMFNHPAALYQTGIGEYPLLMQATFSLWESKKALIEAAYSDNVHGKIVKKTRARNWYKEELFAEFSVESIEQSGSYYPKTLSSIALS